jgi:AGCS family alanine or glycine:cation symporter
MLCLVFFASQTIIGWDYYSERCLNTLPEHGKIVRVYRWLYILAVFIGPYMTVSAVWNIRHIQRSYGISEPYRAYRAERVVARETKDFFGRVRGDRLR